jgi:hypothetical protein
MGMFENDNDNENWEAIAIFPMRLYSRFHHMALFACWPCKEANLEIVWRIYAVSFDERKTLCGPEESIREILGPDFIDTAFALELFQVP